jgi:hypothetical protein
MSIANGNLGFVGGAVTANGTVNVRPECGFPRWQEYRKEQTWQRERLSNNGLCRLVDIWGRSIG